MAAITDKVTIEEYYYFYNVYVYSCKTGHVFQNMFTIAEQTSSLRLFRMHFMSWKTTTYVSSSAYMMQKINTWTVLINAIQMNSQVDIKNMAQVLELLHWYFILFSTIYSDEEDIKALWYDASTHI